MQQLGTPAPLRALSPARRPAMCSSNSDLSFAEIGCPQSALPNFWILVDCMSYLLSRLKKMLWSMKNRSNVSLTYASMVLRVTYHLCFVRRWSKLELGVGINKNKKHEGSKL